MTHSTTPPTALLQWRGDLNRLQLSASQRLWARLGAQMISAGAGGILMSSLLLSFEATILGLVLGIPVLIAGLMLSEGPAPAATFEFAGPRLRVAGHVGVGPYAWRRRDWQSDEVRLSWKPVPMRRLETWSLRFETLRGDLLTLNHVHCTEKELRDLQAMIQWRSQQNPHSGGPEDVPEELIEMRSSRL